MLTNSLLSSTSSNFRQVPDHQEVYLSATGFNAIYFDITERVSHLPTDHDALRFHLEDMVDSVDSRKTWHSDTDAVELPNLPPDTPACALTATVIPPEMAANGAFFPSRPHTPTFTVILLTLIRLVSHSTDVLISISIPHMPGEQEPHDQVDFEQGQMGSLVAEGMRVQDEIRRTLKIHDWGLFAGEE
ncbi:MAG: hypothetical protein LQ342_001395 [Letrouitia transgressa]|nr:MAG: hypothetical protein LQ342_001395 [Letrouitia transgressa]